MNNGDEELQICVHWTIQIGEELTLSRDVAPRHNHEVENEKRADINHTQPTHESPQKRNGTPKGATLYYNFLSCELD